MVHLWCHLSWFVWENRCLVHHTGPARSWKCQHICFISSINWHGMHCADTLLKPIFLWTYYRLNQHSFKVTSSYLAILLKLDISFHSIVRSDDVLVLAVEHMKLLHIFFELLHPLTDGGLDVNICYYLWPSFCNKQLLVCHLQLLEFKLHHLVHVSTHHHFGTEMFCAFMLILVFAIAHAPMLYKLRTKKK